MARQPTVAEVEAAASAFVSAAETNLGVEVSTPVVYPDGQAVTVVVEVVESAYLVHDAGFGAMYLTSTGARFSKPIRRKLASLAGGYGCEFVDGRMQRRCPPDDVAVAIAMVANASRCVGDEAREARRRSEGDFIASISDRLIEAVGRKRLRTNEQLVGESGATYRVHNVVLDGAASTAIAFVEPLSSRAVVAQRFMEFTDLKPAHEGASMYAVADDHEPFSAPHKRLLRKVCTVVPYSKSRDTFGALATG